MKKEISIEGMTCGHCKMRVENALNDALELSQASLGVRMNELLQQTKQLSQQLSQTRNDIAALALNDIHSSSEASELTLFTLNGHIIASSNQDANKLLPVKLDSTTQHLLRQGNDDVGIIPLKDAGLYIRVAVSVPSPDPVNKSRVLQALYPVTERINALASSVQSAFGKYREVAYLRTPLKYSFILTLSLVLLLSILTAIWAAFYSARRMVSPISDLVEGTQAVAAGNYEKRLPLPGKDELGFLVRSFNEMTHKISIAQHEVRSSQQQAETQRAYLEAVLANLSSGVLTLYADQTLRTNNMAASQILGIDLQPYQQLSLDKMTQDYPAMQHFVDVIYQHLDNQQQEWQEEVTLFGTGGRKILICRGTTLPDSSEMQGGSIIVFDDITALMQAQRNAAWSEVARRLAHEIKNPLTPIQLSAERLRHKYLDKMEPKDAEVLDRSTHTIVQQVQTLKGMVKAFSDYARMPEMQLEPVDLNSLINEVLDLYRNSNNQADFFFAFDSSTPHIEADIGRLHQLLHNLIKNALEAMNYAPGSEVYISTRCAAEQSCRFVELKIRDTGPGIPRELFDQLFDPYITTKPKGSGLGLAIVKKIVEEHGGMLWAENANEGGACITIRLPVISTPSEEPEHVSSNDQIEYKHSNDATA